MRYDCNKHYVNNIPIHSCSNDYVLQSMNENILNGRDQLHIAITNTESMFYAELIPSHLEFLDSSTFSLCDGIGSVIAARVQGKKIKRFNGPDLLLKSCSYGQAYGWSHFFYGGKEGVAELLVENLKKKYPKIKIAGTYCPPFRDLNKEEEEEVIARINASGADIIWVGLGLLKQEKWISKYKNRLKVPWAIGVGAAFDFYAGTVKRAPSVYRKIGLEWLYRLAREPRMFKRNINSYKFMISASKKGIYQRLKE